MAQKRPIRQNFHATWVIIGVIFLVGLYLLHQFRQQNRRSARNIEVHERLARDKPDAKKQQVADLDAQSTIDFLPTSTTGVIVKHQGFVLSYNESYEQAEWVAYVLTKAMFTGAQAKRNDNFRADPKVRSYSATPEDYRGSGYDRGHLCPASDMSYSEVAMDQTFLMSNISPQVRNFNGGIWRELEENVKDWARKYHKVYVVTGPILKGGLQSIGKYNKVAVPEAYYKVILSGKLDHAIAYIMPNQKSDRRIEEYATTIDAVEQLTQLNLFPLLWSRHQEAAVEAKYDVNQWPTKEGRYQTRINEWNRR